MEEAGTHYLRFVLRWNQARGNATLDRADKLRHRRLDQQLSSPPGASLVNKRPLQFSRENLSHQSTLRRALCAILRVIQSHLHHQSPRLQTNK